MAQHPGSRKCSLPWLVLLLGVHLLSLLLPVDHDRGHGYQIWYLGAIGTLGLSLLRWTWPWLANLGFYAGCWYLARGQGQKAWVAGFLSTIVALGYLPYVVSSIGEGIASPLGPPYYVWVSGMVLLAVAGWHQTVSTSPPAFPGPGRHPE
jgi:hypothetical protein